MQMKTWLWKFPLRWTSKSRKVRQIARELAVEEGPVFQLVASIEENSIDLARQVIEEAQRKAREEMLRNMPISNYDYLRRPANQSVAGARLASNR